MFLNFTQFKILENLSILDLALSGVKGLNLFAFTHDTVSGYFKGACIITFWRGDLERSLNLHVCLDVGKLNVSKFSKSHKSIL